MTVQISPETLTNSQTAAEYHLRYAQYQRTLGAGAQESAEEQESIAQSIQTAILAIKQEIDLEIEEQAPRPKL